ncbi:hypothetical protein MLD38_039973 [Melastoma candidum]|uniref:Uncharacterized protein n=1 Tax=Melastoma candidum TaxID=119954 RepID=A0ACB9L597_9MYRT|nr:hypothetical protein MLD38_039973 [Melastoma candidum]
MFPLQPSPLFRPFSTTSPATTCLHCTGALPLSIRMAASSPRRERDPRKRVVITGIGLVSAFGSDVDTYYEKLLSGESAVGLIDRFDTAGFPTRIAGQIKGFSARGYVDEEAEQRLDGSQVFSLVAGKRALEHACLGDYKIDRDRVGVIVGSGFGGGTMSTAGVRSLLKEGPEAISPFYVACAFTNMAPAVLAIDRGFRGPTYAISTACASSNHCFHEAANHIRQGNADLIIAGGVEYAIAITSVAGFIACRALSQRNEDPRTASRPWDRDRDGFVIGEGAGLLVMESLEHAMKRDAPILAEYLGSAVNSDAHHMTDPRADGYGISLCIRNALQNAGVAPEEVNYINAHATSTPVGDLAEITAMKKVFKVTPEMRINATKSMLGHCLGAAGGMEAIATIKAIITGWLHPTINQINPEPSVEFNTVPNVKQQHEVNVAISNSFGFGGHNSVVVFSAFKP